MATDIAYYDIYPPVAITRVGDSQEWYIGPEIPGVEPIPEGGFKDANHKIKRCAPRFRVYAFNAQNQVVREITADQHEIKWTVHVANKKGAWVKFRGQYVEEKWELRNQTVQPWPKDQHGREIHSYEHCDTRTKLIIDSKAQAVSGKNASAVMLEGEFWGSKDQPTKVRLGELRTDAAGRLIVIANDGYAYKLGTDGKPETQPALHDKFNNDDWVDPVFDGHVLAEVVVNGQRVRCKNRATVVSAPPRFAHGVHCATTLYDAIEEVYKRHDRAAGNDDVGEVNYYEHIDPLFRRIYMISWTNTQPDQRTPQVDKGHGPKKAQFWFNNSELNDPQTDPESREWVFKRVRAPVVKLKPERLPSTQHPEVVVDPDNKKKRDGQAKPFFMPPLSGDSGDPVLGVADNWLSLTQLQHDRLEKWSKSQFVTGTKPKVYSSFDQIPVKEQPTALRMAALEWSIGAALYPGIETYWVAQFGEMYDLNEPFRFGDKAKPGDLTRGLCLPWQSDFNMCHTNWWPSVRPDAVVTEQYFLQQKLKFEGNLDKLAVNLPNRRKWTEGFDPEDGNSDMVRKWFKLGFVSAIPYGPPEKTKPILVEMQRNL